MKLLLNETRPLSHVPVTIILLLFISFTMQCLWHSTQLTLETRKTDLVSPPEDNLVKLIGLDDSVTAARVLMLWLQAFDNQPGVSLSLTDLDYNHVTEWLALILELDPQMQYPLLAAARFYTEVPDLERQKIMINFIKKSFLQAPNQRWPAMAHAVYTAKHRMKDLQLAVECARLLRLHATADNVPYWAKQMEFFVLEDMGELEAAKILIGGLLDSGELKDKQQIRFLSDRLEQLEEQMTNSSNALNSQPLQ